VFWDSPPLSPTSISPLLLLPLVLLPIMQSSTQLISSWPFTKPRIVLRDQLLSQVNSIPPLRDRTPRAMPETSSPASPTDPNNNDCAGGTSGVMSTSADSDGGGDNGGDGRKGYGKRELSTSKRAAQNRAAQVSCSLPYPSDLPSRFQRIACLPKRHQNHNSLRPVTGPSESHLVKMP